MWIRRLRARTVLQRLHVRFTYALIITAAVAAFFGATGNEWSTQTRFRLIVGIIITQTASIIMLIHKLFDLLASLRSTHRASTYINTIQGLWATLELGAERGGLDPEVRKAIYLAGDEQFALYHKTIGGDGWH